MASEKRLIDANALKKEIVDFKANLCPTGTGYFTGVCVVEGMLACAPTVDAVEVVHGRWIDNIDDKGVLCNAWRKCSACGGLNYSKRPPYCPNCGAKMDGDGNG